MKLKSYSKAVVALVGAAAVVANDVLPVLPAKYKPVADIVVAMAVLLGVYQIPNTPPAKA